MKKVKPGIELKQQIQKRISEFEQGLVLAGIDCEAVDNDILAKIRNEVWNNFIFDIQKTLAKQREDIKEVIEKERKMWYNAATNYNRKGLQVLANGCWQVEKGLSDVLKAIDEI